MTVTVDTFEAEGLDVPLRQSYGHSLAVRTRSDALLVTARAGDLVGYGEGLPRVYVTGEDVPGCLAWLGEAANALLDRPFDSAAEVEAALDALPDVARFPSGRAALESALLDLVGQSQGVPIAALFGAPDARTVYVSGVVTDGDDATATKWLGRVAMFGFSQVKLKIGGDVDAAVARVALARAMLPTVDLRVDANTAFTLDTARAFAERTAAYGVTAIEQPLPRSARADHPALRAAMPPGCALVVDEGVLDAADARWMIEHGGCDRLLLKISKVGGIGPALALAALAHEAGLGVALGCHVGETSFAAAAGLQLAALVPELVTIEACYAPLALARDAAHPSLGFGAGGAVALGERLARAGLGVSLAG